MTTESIPTKIENAQVIKSFDDGYKVREMTLEDAETVQNVST